MDWVMAVFRNYFVISGRAGRKEYWFFVLFTVVASFVLTVIDSILGIAGGLLTLTALFKLSVLIPSITVCVRRLHDTERSGWWILIMLVPLIGWLVLLVFLIQDGTKGHNRFGDEPKLE